MGCVAFDVSSSLLPEHEPYGAVPNITVLSKESVCLFLRVSGEFIALLMSLAQLHGGVYTKVLIEESNLFHLDISYLSPSKARCS